MTAFVKWFQENFKGGIHSRLKGIAYLAQMCQGPPDSIIWQYLEDTGDETYTWDTFNKIYDSIITE